MKDKIFKYEIKQEEVEDLLNKLVSDAKEQVPEQVLIDATMLKIMTLLNYEHKAGYKDGLDFALDSSVSKAKKLERYHKLANELS